MQSVCCGSIYLQRCDTLCLLLWLPLFFSFLSIQVWQLKKSLNVQRKIGNVPWDRWWYGFGSGSVSCVDCWLFFLRLNIDRASLVFYLVAGIWLLQGPSPSLLDALEQLPGSFVSYFFGFLNIYFTLIGGVFFSWAPSSTSYIHSGGESSMMQPLYSALLLLPFLLIFFII